MRIPAVIALTMFASLAAAAERSVSDIAYLVNESDAASIVEPLRMAIASTDALTRTTAARVAMVRNVSALVPLLREQLARESDAIAAREEIRALALLGGDDDVDAAIAAAAKWPASVDEALADAIARRGGLEAIQIYVKKLRALRNIDRSDFFRLALWGRAASSTAAGAMLLGRNDEEGWRALLSTMTAANAAMNGSVIAAGFKSASESIRSDSVWYVARGYAGDPSRIPSDVREAVAATDVASDREAFGREMLRRMLGGEPQERERWKAWLESKEADELLGDAEAPIYNYLTDAEFRIRKARCGLQPTECDMPAKKATIVIPPKAVAPPEFVTPSVLPAGIAAAIRSRNCASPWLGLAQVTVDPAGRTTSVDLGKMAEVSPCASKMLATIIRLSLASNTTILSPMKSDQVLLTGRADRPLCLDESAPDDTPAFGLLRVGRNVARPIVVHRVQPDFPHATGVKMGTHHSVLMILEAVISKEGCVRNIRPIAQTPYPELNGAAIRAFAQWTFKPGTIEGTPVDVIYNLSVNFITD